MNGLRRQVFLAAAGLSAVTSLPAGEHADGAHNPVIWADVPDPSVIRVGAVYYMSSTTMHLSPGLPIMRSEDLVNWTITGYAYETLARNDALNLNNGRSAYGAGSWASSLRYHEGIYYLSTFSSTTGKTHVFSTEDIERGPWREASFSPALHDNSLFFDEDRRVYMVHGSGDIRLTELTADASAIKPGGVVRVIIPNASAVAGPDIGLPAEGSQLRKVNGRYYLLNITWPKGGMRTVLVHRADRIEGPYEGRVALQDRGIAQGGLIDTAEGDWFALLFRDYGAVGRIPYLVPVSWENDWPVLGIEGKAPDSLDLDTTENGVEGIVTSDSFERKPGDRPLPLAWQWNHNPDNAAWSLTDRPGWLRLTNGRIASDLVEARNTLTQRTFGPVSTASIVLDVAGMRDGDVAGLTTLQKNYGYIGIRAENGEKSIVMVKIDAGSPKEFARLPLEAEQVQLRVDCDFRDRTDKAYYYYRYSPSDAWKAIGEPLQMVYTLPHFMGYRFGLFSFATRSPGGSVDFDSFELGRELIDSAGAATRNGADQP